MRFSRQFIYIAVILFSACGVDLPPEVQTACQRLPDQIDYNFHIKPILSDKCYACHVPDENARKGDFRLDIEEEAFATLQSGGHAFVANSPGGSKAIGRILNSDESERMPTVGTPLSFTEMELVKW